MAKLYERKMNYGRDYTNRAGQGLLPWGPGKTISTLQAADLMKVSDDMIRDMCEAGEIEAYRLRENKRSPWRIVKDSFLRHIGRVLDEYGPDGDLPVRSGLPPQPLSRQVPPKKA